VQRFLGKVFLQGKIELLTGMHIGGSRDALEIGGMDNPVIKTLNGVLYLPASSIKGKMRCLLERKYGVKKLGVRAIHVDVRNAGFVFSLGVTLQRQKPSLVSASAVPF